MNSPTTRYVARAILAGLFASAAALKAYLPGVSVDDWLDVLVTGILAAGVWAGTEYATPLNGTVGLNKQPDPPPAPPTTFTTSTGTTITKS